MRNLSMTCSQYVFSSVLYFSYGFPAANRYTSARKVRIQYIAATILEFARSFKKALCYIKVNNHLLPNPI